MILRICAHIWLHIDIDSQLVLYNGTYKRQVKVSKYKLTSQPK